MSKGSSDKRPAYYRTNDTLLSEIEQYQQLTRMNQLADDIVGYQRTDSGFEPIRKPPRGSIVTHAFIICSKCQGSVYHCSGPRLNALCLPCFRIEDNNPNIKRSDN